MELRGTVRFRFRSPEHDVDVLLEGDAGWVNGIREELGLSGNLGVLQPLAARLVESDEPKSASAMGEGDEEKFEEMPMPEEAVLPGTPVLEANSIAAAAALSAANPWAGLIVTIRTPRVLITLLPPIYVPIAITIPDVTMTHKGTSNGIPRASH